MEEELVKLRLQVQEEQRRREEAEDRILEEQQHRKEAEELARASQPLTLENYLEACHSLNCAIQVVTDRSLTTQGDTTNPTGRIFPRRIIPWDDFATKQEEIWHQVSTGQLFASRPVFPSQHQLEYVRSLLKPISSEVGLRDFERDVVENSVQKLVNEANKDPLLRTALGLQGTVTFESHTNLGGAGDTISAYMERMSIEEGRTGVTTAASKSTVPKARRKAQGKGNRADQFCIYRTSDGRNIPALAIEYKAPHKLSMDTVVAGLESEIRPERDVINKDGEGFEFASKSLAAAVITQLFSYMIGKGIQYGYVCTGQTFIFLHIPSDPTVVYFSVCVPNLDVLDDDDNRLHRTAVAQVFAFILRALCAEPPPMSWHDAAAKLDIWAVEYDDVLRNIPETVRKGKELPATKRESRRSTYGGPMDDDCPNFDDHGDRHIDRLEFLRLIRIQLACDRGPDANCAPLYLSGSVGALFKARLSCYGYTLVAKGVKRPDLALLRHENDLYDRVRAIQGSHVPVCLGKVDLILPCYYDGGVYEYLLFLGWAGRPLLECTSQISKTRVIDAVTAAFTELHKLRVLHHDAKPRNLLYDVNSSRLMIVDLERAEFCSRQPLGVISPNRQYRKRKRKMTQRRGKDPFARELHSVVEYVASCMQR
ncbi:hypothetical protein HYQ46_009485 [Verticillium longisporum]|nr:hypothetical protein HYQ46_009485 [Verticillium longisporum]